MTTRYLAYFPSPPRGVWYLGPVPVRAYALFIIVGIVAALLIGDRRWVARGGERGVTYDIALWAVPFGLLGGRLYHVCTDWRTYFGAGGAGLNAALRIWDGGLGIWGAVALGGVGAWIACRRRKIPLAVFGDAVAPGIILAQGIGRLGNYFNQELFGRETTMPWGLEIFYRRDPSGYIDVHSLDGVSTGQLAQIVQPTFLYEMLWNLLVFGALLYLDKRFVLDRGRLFATYVAAYCVGRFSIELLRDDAATHIAGIRINSFTSTFVFIGAVVYIILVSRVREDSVESAGATVVASPPLPGPAFGESTAVPSGTRDAVVSDQSAVSVPTLEPEAEAIVAEAEAVEGDVPETEVRPVDDEPVEAEVAEADVAPAETEVADTEVEPAEAEAAQTEVRPVDDEPVEAEVAGAEVEPAEAEVAQTEVRPVDDEPVDTEVVEAEVEPAEAEVAQTEVRPVDDEPVETDADVAPAETEVADTEVEPVEAEVAEADVEPVEAEAADAEVPPVDDEPVETEADVAPAETEVAGAEVEPVETEVAEADVAPAETEVADTEVEPVEAEVAEADVEPVEAEVAGAEVEPVETEVAEADVAPAEADELPPEEPALAEPEAEPAEPDDSEVSPVEAAPAADVVPVPDAETDTEGESESEIPQKAETRAGDARDNYSAAVRPRWWRRRR